MTPGVTTLNADRELMMQVMHLDQQAQEQKESSLHGWHKKWYARDKLLSISTHSQH